MAKWLDKLKAVFVKAPVEIESPVEVFVPKVGQLMWDTDYIAGVLASIDAAQDGQKVYNPEKQKWQTVRSKPMVAVLFLYGNFASIRLHGYRLTVFRNELQFK